MGTRKSNQSATWPSSAIGRDLPAGLQCPCDRPGPYRHEHCHLALLCRSLRLAHRRADQLLRGPYGTRRQRVAGPPACASLPSHSATPECAGHRYIRRASGPPSFSFPLLEREGGLRHPPRPSYLRPPRFLLSCRRTDAPLALPPRLRRARPASLWPAQRALRRTPPLPAPRRPRRICLRRPLVHPQLLLDLPDHAVLRARAAPRRCRHRRPLRPRPRALLRTVCPPPRLLPPPLRPCRRPRPRAVPLDRP